ncbi:MAG: glutamine synthetase family protein [Candidatus Helarchaeota archaeon]
MIDKEDKKRKDYIDNVIERIQKNKIQYIQFHFTDIHGIIKSFAIRAKSIEDYFEDGAYFDGSSITGYGNVEESDMVAVPDPSTFQILPWTKESNLTARLICDIYTPELRPFEGDPRYILKRVAKKADEMGYKYYCAPEMEFFLLEPDTLSIAKPSDLRGYFDFDPKNINELMRHEMSDLALKMDIEIETLHHEVATGQHEIDIKYGECIETADRTITLKMIVKIVAGFHNMIGTFMPKPFYGVNGSGMHVHQSLWKDGKNVFYDPDDQMSCSYIMKQFIAGQLKYGKEICAVLASWPNSYKRLVPGYEAPVYLAWDYKNRSALIRVPNFGNKPSGARFEIRCPDPAGNPYLQFAVLLAAGLKGIEENIDPAAPTNENLFDIDVVEMKKRNIKALPASLIEALEYFEKSELMKSTFGDDPFKNFLYAKLSEWDEYRQIVHPWELSRYINKL